MVTEKDIRETIAEIESKDHNSIDDCLRLSALYNILDRQSASSRQTDLYGSYAQAANPDENVKAAEIVGDYGDSEFLKAMKGVNVQDAWLLVDELMESLKIVNKRLYDSVMRKIA